MRHALALTVSFCALTLLVAACGGGGGSGSNGLTPVHPVPVQPAGGIAMTIKIPTAPAAPSSRRGYYISPATQSIGIVVSATGLSPSPAQFVNVSSCPVVSGVTTCTINVQASYGPDTFTITAYSGQNGTGSALSTGSMTSTITAAGPNSVSVTLGGIIGSITIAAGISPLPLGQSTTLNVVVKDPAGATYIGTYPSPITLTAPNLTVSATNLPDSTTASNIKAAWSYGFTGGSTPTLSATGGGVTGTVPLAPGSGFAYWQTGTNPTVDVTSFKMIIGPDAKVYYTTVGTSILAGHNFVFSNTGAIHQFDPVTSTDTEIVVSPSSGSAGMKFTSDGALWIGGGTSVPGVSTNGPQALRMAPGSFSAAALTAIPLPTVSPFTGAYSVRSIAEDGLGNVWTQDLQGHRYMKLPVAGPYTMSSVTAYTLPLGPVGTTRHAKGSARSVLYDAGSIIVPDFVNGTVNTVDPATGTITGTYVSNLQLLNPYPTFDSSSEYDAVDDGTSVYMTELGYNGALPYGNGAIEKFNASTHTFTTLPQVHGTNGQEPAVPSLSGSLLYYADFAKGSFDVVNLSNNTARSVPLIQYGQSIFTTPATAGAQSDGTAWFACLADSGLNTVYTMPMCIAHTVYVNGWSIWPSTSILLNGAGIQSGQLMGIMEAPSANSGPFTVTSSNTAVCTIANANDHNFIIVGVSIGTCAVTVNDASNVSETVNVTVNAITNGVVQGKKAGNSL